jgi:hypothetical protein
MRACFSLKMSAFLNIPCRSLETLWLSPLCQCWQLFKRPTVSNIGPHGGYAVAYQSLTEACPEAKIGSPDTGIGCSGLILRSFLKLLVLQNLKPHKEAGLFLSWRPLQWNRAHILARAVGLNWNGVKVTVCGGYPMLQIGVWGNLDWLIDWNECEAKVQ